MGDDYLDDDYGGGEVVQQVKYTTLGCTEEQHEHLMAAVAVASRLAGRPLSVTMAVELICLNFMASNDYAKPDAHPAHRAAFLREVERAFGIKLVAFKKNDIVYGYETLEEAARHGA